MNSKKRTFSKEFKLHVLREVGFGKTAAEIARQYQVHPALLSRWRNQYETYADEAFWWQWQHSQRRSPHGSPGAQDRPAFGGERTVRKSVIAARFDPRLSRRGWRDRMIELVKESLDRGVGLSVKSMCEVLSLSRAALYRRAGAEALDDDTELRDEIQHIALDMPAYGYRRIAKALARQGHQVNHKRVLRLMREDNLLCLRKRKYISKGSGIAISMSRSGNPYDNAKAESFMKTLKYEEVYLWEYDSFEDAKEQIEHFLEDVYNMKRLHSAVGYLPPAEFEQELEAATP